MSRKIVFLNTGHFSLDDRVFYHQAKCLSENDFEIQIISTKEKLVKSYENISVNSYDDDNLTQKEKLKKIQEYLTGFLPDIIICDTPLAVIASSIYKKNHKTKIIYDITEWYPSKKNLQDMQGLKRIQKFIFLTILNMFAGFKSDSFIFGEYYKSFPFKILYFWKQFFYLPYYPDLNYIRYYPLKKIDSELNLFYSGIINADKGIDTVIKAIDIASKNCPDIQFNLTIIGYFPTSDDQVQFKDLCAVLNENVDINIEKYLPFTEFCKVLGDTHLYFDLRKIDLENTLCLPIKLFYYLACGRPVIYSNLRSIRKEIKNFNFGYLCDPNDVQKIASHITEYIVKPEIYNQHAGNALEASGTKYNWGIIEKDFISFLQNIKS